jgi:type VI secretion system protein ImpL
MGVIHQNLSGSVTEFLDNAMKSIGERLRNIRIMLLHVFQAKNVDPRILLFPEEFDNLKPGLEMFIKGAFQENPYQETPVLRGLYFSSGRQEGSPYSHFLSALGLIEEKDVLPGTSKGLFLHDFFEKILPKDRRLFAPTKRAIEWRTLTRNLGLLSWILLGVAMCGLLSFSFVKNLRTLREVSHEFANPQELKGELLADLATMDQSKKAILRVEDQNQHWWIPRLGLKESLYLEQGLKEKFCKYFQQGFMAPFDKKMTSLVANRTGAIPDDATSQYVAHLVRRINLLKARLDNESLSTLKTRPQPPSAFLVSTDNQESTPEERERFGSLYLYYILWRTDLGEINKEIEILQSWLKHVLSLSGNDLQWLVTWVNQEGKVNPVTLGQFWGGIKTSFDEKTIAPAYTRKGKDSIDSFISEIESALPAASLIAAGKHGFEKNYRSNAFAAWRDFAVSFSDGVKRLKTEKDWQLLVDKMPTGQGPYYSFLDAVAADLEPLAKGEGAPVWLTQIYEFQTIKTLGSQAGFVVKTAEAGKNLFSKLEKTIKKESGEIPESQITAAMAYHEYSSALNAITQLEKTRNEAFQATMQAYTEAPAAGKSPFANAYNASIKLKNSMSKELQNDDIVWKLIVGPFDYLWTFARVETACFLRSQWEEKVLSETQAGGEHQAVQILTKQDNPVTKFVKGPLEPFLGYTEQRGYLAKEVLGGAIPFEPSFLTFLNNGAQVPRQLRQSYSVTIRGLPTDVNREAWLKPHGTRLELQCAGGNPQILINLHYPISKSFQWSPESCGLVVFQIEVSNLVLTKKYEGPQAFAIFIQDFGSGTRTFFPREFPEERNALEKLGIRYIKVNYQFSGDHDEVKQFVSMSGQIPKRIAPCWEQ